MQPIRLLGIHSSPIKDGNCAYLLDYALNKAVQQEGVVADKATLGGLKISDCVQCNWCMKKQTADRLCNVEDDALPILHQIDVCDILILMTPVYFARLSGAMACLLDRTRCFLFGKEKRQSLKGKIGIAMAVGWMRNGGIETTLESVHSAFLLHEMWTPSVHEAGTVFGVGAVSGPLHADQPFKRDRLGVKEDGQALRATDLFVKKAVETARMLRRKNADAADMIP